MNKKGRGWLWSCVNLGKHPAAFLSVLINKWGQRVDPIYSMFFYARGVLGISSHTPQGHAPLQNPHPMHLDSSTTYSKPVAFSCRLMAPSGQTATQRPQSLQFPQEAQSSPHASKVLGSCLGL